MHPGAAPRRYSVKKFNLKNFEKFTEKHLCFPLNLAKFLKTLFFKEHLWLLLVDAYLDRLLSQCQRYNEIQ